MTPEKNTGRQSHQEPQFCVSDDEQNQDTIQN